MWVGTMGSAQVRTEGVLRELIFFFVFSKASSLSNHPKTQNPGFV